jgi:hypothetical protein
VYRVFSVNLTGLTLTNRGAVSRAHSDFGSPRSPTELAMITPSLPVDLLWPLLSRTCYMRGVLYWKVAACSSLAHTAEASHLSAAFNVREKRERAHAAMNLQCVQAMQPGQKAQKPAWICTQVLLALRIEAVITLPSNLPFRFPNRNSRD